tara:strand:+ start:1307 stop:2035 length:729 start_codon:yes stop_codon:yes gene_type:complete
MQFDPKRLARLAGLPSTSSLLLSETRKNISAKLEEIQNQTKHDEHGDEDEHGHQLAEGDEEKTAGSAAAINAFVKLTKDANAAYSKLSAEAKKELQAGGSNLLKKQAAAKKLEGPEGKAYLSAFSAWFKAQQALVKDMGDDDIEAAEAMEKQVKAAGGEILKETDDELIEIDEVAIKREIIKMKQERLAESKLRNVIRAELSDILEDAGYKLDASWVYGEYDKPKHSKNGQIIMGIAGLGFK